MNFLKTMQENSSYHGKLQVSVTSQINARPIADATIQISYSGVPENTIEKLTTNSSGQTDTIELASPPLEYSLNPSIEEQPYSEYTLNEIGRASCRERV